MIVRYELKEYLMGEKKCGGRWKKCSSKLGIPQPEQIKINDILHRIIGTRLTAYPLHLFFALACRPPFNCLSFQLTSPSVININLLHRDTIGVLLLERKEIVLEVVMGKLKV